MEGKHTPGPWGWVLQDGEVLELHGKEYSEGESILAVNVGDNSNADLHLIAAAPDLLEACKNAKGLLQWHAAGIGEDYAKRWEEIYDALCAAIAKAEGKVDR